VGALTGKPAVGETTAMNYRGEFTNRRGSRPAAPWLKWNEAWNVNSGAFLCGASTKSQITKSKQSPMTKSQ
jgi:hypothetical protein